jgi:hypothetical protein
MVMNPVVVMAMYGRRKLVETNLRLLSEQNCTVVVAASIYDDFNFLRELRIPNLQIIPTSNKPLGRKWQEGVDSCRILDANPLIILGSDDFLSQNFVKKACELAKEFDFVFFDKWFILDQQSGKQYSLRYNMMKHGKPPLGSGRIFSKAFLERHHWQLFDTSLNIKLDDFIYDNILSDDKILLNPDGMNILAVKGNHETMNPLNKILSNQTIDWTPEKTIAGAFNFRKPIKELFECAE